MRDDLLRERDELVDERVGDVAPADDRQRAGRGVMAIGIVVRMLTRARVADVEQSGVTPEELEPAVPA